MPRLQWYKFSPSLDSGYPLSSFIEEVKKKIRQQSAASQATRKKLYRHTTNKAIRYDPIAEHKTFWDCNFENKLQVTWNEFQNRFQAVFKTEISELYKSKESPRLLFDVLKHDLFDATEKITKAKFLEVIGDSKQKNHFWKIVSEKATEKYCLKEVLDMHSAVRLTAGENLGKLYFCIFMD